MVEGGEMAEQEAPEEWQQTDPWYDLGLVLRSLLLMVSGKGVNPDADFASGDAAAIRLVKKGLAFNKAQQEVWELRAEVAAVLSNLSNYERERPDVQALLRKVQS